MGLAAGILSGLFGIGGGVVIVAALVSLAKFPIHKATGTSLAALLLPVAVFGVLEYWKGGHVDIRAAALLAVGLLVGAWIGARFALQLNGVTLQRAFSVFLVAIAVRMWIKAG
ncbi:MAG TPA: sulfite exporter TauE/SafE family protein [Gemmatimonadales bacterium]|nr:sulfite exporter TauE/SafE family protein [Gemmatimonadales bacterium]